MKFLSLRKLVCGILCALSSASLSAQLSTAPTAKTGATPAATPAATTTAVTTSGGTNGLVPVFTGASTIGNSIIYANSTSVGIGIAPSIYGVLDVGGQAIFRGAASLARTGNASPTTGTNSYPFLFGFQHYNSAAKFVYNPYFSFQAEATGNNTANPAGTMNLLYYNGIGGKPAETGLYFNTNGTIHFSPSQTFPITTGATGPAGPQGPAGPTGAKGATGATGPQGPSGTLALPYAGSGAGNGKPAFQVTNTGAYSNTSPYYPDGIAGYGGSSGTISYSTGGTGITGYGGAATSSSGIQTYGGIGVIGRGGVGNPSGNSSSGGFGGEFYGGDSGGGTNGFGGDGVVAFGGSPNGIGLYVYSAGETTANTAAVFIGAVDVYGTLYKSSGAFKIDHPVDPANKYLVHSFVESPDMMNIYNGNVITDGRGEAVVTMPDYFEALNRDFRYQLTVMGQFAQAIVGSKINHNYFIIKTDKPGVEVSWQVTGVRQDAWANAHRLPNEVEKDASEKGHFLHPELFGHPEDISIGALKHSRLAAPQQ